jgi:FlaA1/EpsC-like NDP-sugar epimerase
MNDRTLLQGKNVLITGATGSLGKVLLRRILSGEAGQVDRLVALSRDEAKQHEIRVEYQKKRSATDEVIYRNFMERLTFRIGDVRDFASVCAALQGIDIVFNAAALKQVPTCEYFPFEAVQTNVVGPENIVRAVRDLNLPVEAVVGVSTDKAVKPVNVMGMTKALQERVFTRANLEVSRTRFVIVRYGNVLASRGSVIPLFHEQIRSGGPVTITDPEMTRFLLSLDDAVDLIFAALRDAQRGEIYIPRTRGARVVDVAQALIGGRPIELVTIGVRPGEKIHEILISEEEAHRAFVRDAYYVIGPLLPELQQGSVASNSISGEYSSADDLLSPEGVVDLLRRKRLMVEDNPDIEGELLR